MKYMKWVLVFIAFCFSVIPAMGETVDTTISETDTLSILSPENVQALVVFNDFIEELNAMKGNDGYTDAEADELIIKLMDVFIEEGAEGQTETTLRKLMNAALSNSTGYDEVAETSLDDGYSPVYVIDTVVTLFFMAGNIAEDNKEYFVENLAYLEGVILQMERNDNVDPDYLRALKTAASGWKEAYGIEIDLVDTYFPDMAQS